MASAVSTILSVCAGCGVAGASSLPSASLRPAVLPLVSGFYGSQIIHLVTENRERKLQSFSGKVYATAVVETGIKQYTRPTWADFEIGHYPVFWETATGRPAAAGSLLTIYFNPTSSKLVPNADYGIGFNGGFNQPIMCGGEHRGMTRKERGIKCAPFYTIKINVPVHARTLEYSFTDGSNWDGPYMLELEIPAKWQNMPLSFFNEGLAKELAHEGACNSAIYPDAVFVQDRCDFPAGMIQEGGDRCELDIVPGCTDPESPFFDPLANVDDGSCPYVNSDE